MGEIRLKVIEGYVEKPEYWVTHRRSKNYLAKLVGFDDQYTFRRKFLERKRVGNRTYFRIEDFQEGEVYELRCIYYSGSWRAYPKYEGFLRCESIDSEEVVLKEITEEEATKIVKEKYPESAKLLEIKREIEKLKKEKDETRRELEALKVAKEELEKEIPLVDVEEVKRIKEQLRQRIIQMAKSLLEFGSMKYRKRKYSTDKIEIKEEDGELKYVLVNGAYVVSQYDNEHSIDVLYRAYMRIKEELEAKKGELEKIKEEVKS